MFYGLNEYLVVVAVVSIVIHTVIRGYWTACSFASVVSSVVNLAHETWMANFDVRPEWGSFMIGVGILCAFPVCMVIGVPFACFRKAMQNGRTL